MRSSIHHHYTYSPYRRPDRLQSSSTPTPTPTTSSLSSNSSSSQVGSATPNANVTQVISNNTIGSTATSPSTPTPVMTNLDMNHRRRINNRHVRHHITNSGIHHLNHNMTINMGMNTMISVGGPGSRPSSP